MRWPRRRRTRQPRECVLALVYLSSSLVRPSDSYHLGQLKAKLAKLRRELIEPRTGSGGGASLPAFEVAKTGMASVGFVGFPSVVSRLCQLPEESMADENVRFSRVNQP